MAKNKPLKHAEVNGWHGQGNTVAEAKQDAIAKSEKAASGYYTPKVIQWKGYTVFIYREPLAWSYIMYCPGDQEEGILKAKHGQWSASWTEEKNCVRDALNHLANITHKPGEEPNPPPFLTDENDRKEYIRDALWQNGYKAHKDANPNATDNQCRDAACEAQYAYDRQRYAS